VAVGDHAARERPVSFEHETHRELRCVECHSTPVTLVAAPAARACASCHSAHHRAAGQCAACHGPAEPRGAHAALPDAHVACDACHTEAVVGMLTPDRGLCLTCHAEQRQHEPGGECSTCHLLATPEAFKPFLRKAQ
jgi:hypothetical protein